MIVHYWIRSWKWPVLLGILCKYSVSLILDIFTFYPRFLGCSTKSTEEFSTNRTEHSWLTIKSVIKHLLLPSSIYCAIKKHVINQLNMCLIEINFGKKYATLKSIFFLTEDFIFAIRHASLSNISLLDILGFTRHYMYIDFGFCNSAFFTLLDCFKLKQSRYINIPNSINHKQ